MKTEIVNAKIKSTMLGKEDHGIFTCYLFLEGDGWGCGFGGYGMDEWNEKAKRRLPTAYGMDFIASIMATLEIESWEKLPGTFVRAETEGCGGTVKRIGHPLKNKWFDPEKLRLEYFAEVVGR